MNSLLRRSCYMKVRQDQTAQISRQLSTDLIENTDGKIFRITLNRTKKKNAITGEMYEEITNALKRSAECRNTSVTVISSSGTDYFSSGNDLNFMSGINKDTLPQFVKVMSQRLRQFVAAYIDHPKPLIALVQGPAVGIATTSLALCDVVMASNTATFNTPFARLGQAPEACSSYTFPRIMGNSLASEVLYFDRKLTSEEAYHAKLVSRLLKHDNFPNEAWNLVNNYAAQDPEVSKSLRVVKNVVRPELVRNKLHQINIFECEQLEQAWQSEQCAKALRTFFTRKK